MRKAILFTFAALMVVALASRPYPVQATGSATLTIAGATQGPPGTQVSYTYSSIYQSCAAEAKDPKTLQIQLMWDQPAQVIGMASLTINKAAMECDGLVTGTVPAGASPGDHIATAFLVDTATSSAQVAGSSISAASPFTVPGVPTAAGSGSGGAVGTAGTTSAGTAVPFSWIGVGALAMLDVLLAAALVFVLTHSRRPAGRKQ
jgi:hypothetical protein